MNATSLAESAARGLSGAGAVAVPAQNRLHLILEIQLPLLEGDFFELFGFGEVMAVGQVVNLFAEVVMLRGQSAVLLVALQQFALQLFEVCRHFRLLWKDPTCSAVQLFLASAMQKGKVAQSAVGSLRSGVAVDNLSRQAQSTV